LVRITVPDGLVAGGLDGARGSGNRCRQPGAANGVNGHGNRQRRQDPDNGNNHKEFKDCEACGGGVIPCVSGSLTAVAASGQPTYIPNSIVASHLILHGKQSPLTPDLHREVFHFFAQ